VINLIDASPDTLKRKYALLLLRPYSDYLDAGLARDTKTPNTQQAHTANSVDKVEGPGGEKGTTTAEPAQRPNTAEEKGTATAEPARWTDPTHLASKQVAQKLLRAVVRRMYTPSDSIVGPDGESYVRVEYVDRLGVDVETFRLVAKALSIEHLVAVMDAGKHKAVFARERDLQRLAEALKSIR